ncbi:MAG: hypothetical protein WBB28_14635 [Crinalium sp.]
MAAKVQVKPIKRAKKDKDIVKPKPTPKTAPKTALKPKPTRTTRTTEVVNTATPVVAVAKPTPKPESVNPALERPAKITK